MNRKRQLGSEWNMIKETYEMVNMLFFSQFQSDLYKTAKSGAKLKLTAIIFIRYHLSCSFFELLFFLNLLFIHSFFYLS